MSEKFNENKKRGFGLGLSRTFEKLDDESAVKLELIEPGSKFSSKHEEIFGVIKIQIIVDVDEFELDLVLFEFGVDLFEIASHGVISELGIKSDGERLVLSHETFEEL